MRCKIHDIYFVIKVTLVGLLVMLAGNLHASSDTIPQAYKTEFSANLTALSNLYYWNDSSYLKGEFTITNDVDFSGELQKHNILFEIHAGAEDFFNFLQDLNLLEKKKLIAYFSYYESYFEKELKDAGLPKELKYLAPTISAMNPLAVGENKRAGIWQLQHFQGVLNGLEVGKLVDERFSETLSTKAFIQQLKSNESIFGSHELAVIAYFVGNTKLQNTLARLGSYHSLTEVLALLPASVTNKIAAYQAIGVFLATNTFNTEVVLETPDVVSVNRQLHFQQISQVLNIPEAQLRFLNPQYKYAIVPGDKKVMRLNVPKGKHDDFILWSDSIYNAYDSTLFQVVAQKIEYPPAPNRQYVGEKVKDLEIEGKTKIKYTIKSGDVLGFIAEDYDVRVADLKYWNNIYNERRIQVGQKLDIFVDDEQAEYYSNLQNKSKTKEKAQNTATQFTVSSPLPIYKAPESAKKVEHVVKSGESPYVIAKKYEGVTPEEILEWNGIKDARKIQIGQKLIIYLE